MMTKRTSCSARASSRRLKSVTISGFHFVEEAKELAHPIEALRRRQGEALIDLRHVDAGLDLVEQPVLRRRIRFHEAIMAVRAGTLAN